MKQTNSLITLKYKARKRKQPTNLQEFLWPKTRADQKAFNNDYENVNKETLIETQSSHSYN